MLSPILSNDQVKNAAITAGFSLVGLARAEALDPGPLERWLAAGYAGCMADMHERQGERLDPRILLPGAKTVISVACCYAQTSHGQPSSIARYARGRDYHHTLQDRLRALRRALVALTPTEPRLMTYASVDMGPVMEKVWAARAGLGWLGKNGLLVTRAHGTRVVLGAMLLDREVDRYDAPVSASDSCGACVRCLAACPSGALLGSGVLDARRCLACETTAQRDAPFSQTLLPVAGPYAFGCEACQDCCPWNRPGHACDDPRFIPRPFASFTLRELVRLGPAQHREFTQGTAVVRAHHDGLRRNALAALAREGVRADDPDLRDVASDTTTPLASALAAELLARAG